jgi:hypothetical protein
MLTFNPYSQVPTQAHLPGEATHSLQDVRNWLDEPSCHLAPDTSLAYRRAIDRCCKILEKAPKDIIANRRDVLASLPITKFNSSWAKNTSSAKRLLRNLGCAINSALGAKARKQNLRTANDRWKQLIGALHDHLHTSDQPIFSEKKLIAMNVLADAARANDIDSHELDTAACKTILDAAAHSKQLKTLRDALKFIALGTRKRSVKPTMLG